MKGNAGGGPPPPLPPPPHRLHYRCYLLDDRGSIRRGTSLQCGGDHEAFDAAMTLCRGQPFEVWQGVRQVHVYLPSREGAD